MSTHNVPFSISKKKIILIYPKYAAMGFCSRGLKNEFETAMVNEPSVFEPLKIYCSSPNAFFCFSVIKISVLISAEFDSRISFSKLNIS